MRQPAPPSPGVSAVEGFLWAGLRTPVAGRIEVVEGTIRFRQGDALVVSISIAGITRIVIAHYNSILVEAGTETVRLGMTSEAIPHAGASASARARLNRFIEAIRSSRPLSVRFSSSRAPKACPVCGAPWTPDVLGACHYCSTVVPSALEAARTEPLQIWVADLGAQQMRLGLLIIGIGLALGIVLYVLNRVADAILASWR